MHVTAESVVGAEPPLGEVTIDQLGVPADKLTFLPAIRDGGVAARLNTLKTTPTRKKTDAINARWLKKAE